MRRRRRRVIRYYNCDRAWAREGGIRNTQETSYNNLLHLRSEIIGMKERNLEEIWLLGQLANKNGTLPIDRNFGSKFRPTP